MAKEKKQLRELSEEELKNVTGGGYIVYVETNEDDLIDTDPYKNPDGTCKQGFVLNDNGKCDAYAPFLK